MEEIVIGSYRYALRPYVEEAVAHFGYVRPEAVDWLTTELAAAFNRNMGRTIRESGTRRGGRFSQEVWESLTDAGRANPVERFDATCARAAQRLRTTAQADRYQRTANIFVGLRFSALETTLPPCKVAAQLHGMLLEDPVLLPLPECDQERCGCSWRPVTPRELRSAGE